VQYKDDRVRIGIAGDKYAYIFKSKEFCDILDSLKD